VYRQLMPDRPIALLLLIRALSVSGSLCSREGLPVKLQHFTEMCEKVFQTVIPGIEMKLVCDALTLQLAVQGCGAVFEA
jgi:hypothetical protein